MSDTKIKSDMNEIFLAPAPHVVTPVSTHKLMRNVVIALAPIVIYSVYLYSWAAVIRICVSVLATVLFESLFRMILHRDVRVKDYSAIITGLLLALVMPPALPIWMLIVSSFFAIVVGKEFFGGLGQNIFNPALIGRAVAFMSFAGPMTSWTSTRQSGFFGGLSGEFQNSLTTASAKTVDALAGATPLWSINPIDGVITSAADLATNLGFDSKFEFYLSLLIGNHRGSLGESPALLILISLVFLLVTKTVNWRIPVSMILSSAIFAWILGIDPVLTVLSGGLLLGAVFMATDYVTSPVTPIGRIIFGVGCGVLTVAMRVFSSLPEGVMFSILTMNAVTPFLNKIIPRKYGYVKGAKK
ncbi:MAG: NADH-quinone reductase [Treponema sp.]|nr:MAG: NADH-quinone reductase [Treponema sp.]